MVVPKNGVLGNNRPPLNVYASYISGPATNICHLQARKCRTDTTHYPLDSQDVVFRNSVIT